MGVLTLFVVVSRIMLECNIDGDGFEIRYGRLNDIVIILRFVIIINLTCSFSLIRKESATKEVSNSSSIRAQILSINALMFLILFLYPIVSVKS